MKAFTRILSYARPYSRFWPGYLISSILSVIFGVVNYALIKPLLEVLFDPDAVEKYTTLPDFSFSVDYFYGVFQYYLTRIMEASGVLRSLLFVCLVPGTAQGRYSFQCLKRCQRGAEQCGQQLSYHIPRALAGYRFPDRPVLHVT